MNSSKASKSSNKIIEKPSVIHKSKSESNGCNDIMEKNIAVAHVFNLIHIKTSCTEKMKKTVVIASDSIIQAIDSHSLSQSVTKRIP